MGKPGPSRIAYLRARKSRGLVAPMPGKVCGDLRSCPAASLFLYSRGYAHSSVGSGPSRSLSYPGGRYSVPLSSSPSGRLYRMISFCSSRSEG